MPPAGKSGRKSKNGASGAPSVEDAAAVGDEVSDVNSAVSDGCGQDSPEISSGVSLEEMKDLKRQLENFICENWRPEYVAEQLGIMSHIGNYERMLVRLMVENAKLKEKLEVVTSQSYIAKMASAAVKVALRTVAPVVAPAANPAVAPAAVPVAAPAAIPVAAPAATTVAASAVIPVAAPAVIPVAAIPVVTTAAVPAVPAVGLNAGMPLPKPVETWSVVVRGKKGVSSKEVVDKVVKQVGPTLGVRVHEVKQLRDGGAVIRTPTVVERERLVENRRFKELDLEVMVNEKVGPRVLVSGVFACIAPDEFMADLFGMNFKEHMDIDAFRKKVRLVSKPWSSDKADAPVNVVLEGEEGAMRRLLEVGRVYIKWYSFRVRLQDAIPHCFRCLGFDHRVRECRMREDICRSCGMGGHMAFQCKNAVRCGNCANKGLPADHAMLSYSCPIYAGLLARANARH